MILKFSFTEPSRAPEIQVHSPNTSSLILSWNRVNSEYLHGIHRGYCIYHNNELIHVNDSSVRMKLLEGFRPYSKHTIQIAAKTSPGCGIFTPMETYFTAESSKYFFLIFVIYRNHIISSLGFSLCFNISIFKSKRSNGIVSCRRVANGLLGGGGGGWCLAVVILPSL